MSMLDQEIQVEDNCTEKKYFSQIPNIIHKMGLGPYVVSYYCLLKSIAGDKKSCFMSQKKIASLLGCSERKVRLMNDFMSKPFEILGGKSLITVTAQKGSDGVSRPNLIQVVDIWMENIVALNEKKIIPQTPSYTKKDKIKKKIQVAPGSTYPAPGSTYPAPGADKEEPRYNNPGKNMYFKDLGQDNRVLDKSKKKNLEASVRWKLDTDQEETFHFLKSLDIDADDGKLAYWSKTQSLKRLTEVYYEAKHYKPQSMRKYMAKLIDENKPVPNANSEMNRQFALDYIKSNNLKNIKIFRRYAKVKIGADYAEISFDVTPDTFVNILIHKLEVSENQ